ncbi:MAG: lipid A export permease/ATP-binding protein MsbA [Thiomicrospira sp.]
MNHTTLTLYKRLLRYLRPYWKMVGVVIVTLGLVAATEPLMPMLLKYLVDDSLIAQDPTMIKLVPALILLVFIVKGLAEYASKVASSWVAHKAILDIRAQMFAKINRLPLQTHHDYSTGHLLSKITYDVPQVANSLSEAWIILIRDTLIIIGLLGYMLYTSWQLTLLMLMIGPIVAWIIDRASKLMRNSSTEMQNSMGELTQRLEEGLNGYKDIKVYGAETYEEKRFLHTAEGLRRHTMNVIKVSAANVPLVQMLAAIALALVVYVASNMSAQGHFTPGEFIAFVTAMALIFEPIRRLTSVNQTLQQGMAASESIFTLLDLAAEANPGQHIINEVKGELRLANLSFHYPQQAQGALRHLNLTFKANQTTALVGQSGSGKTTLANLLARFYTPTEGQIYLDNIDIQQLDLTHYRQLISFVSQNVILFNDTIRANIAYGHDEFDEAAIIQAAKDAHAWEFIERLPQGLDTPVGNNGALLSGGQRQRLAIARAFLKNAPILIMDEATSALDNQSEAMIQQAMQQLRQGRTVIIIAHRLSTIENADQIAVMAQGELKELGSHAQLLQQNGLYAALYQQGKLDEP